MESGDKTVKVKVTAKGNGCIHIKFLEPQEQSNDASADANLESERNQVDASTNNVAAPSESYNCPKCGKAFKSIKAVHGHMRLHNKGKDQSSKEKEEIKPIADSSSQRAVPAPNPAAETGVKRILDYRNLEVLAAYSVVQLTNINENRFCSKLVALRDVEGSTSSSGAHSEKEGNGEVKTEAALSSQPSSVIRSKRRKVEHQELEPEDRRYQCHICDKSFPTHQALGGHTASHNKAKNSLEEVTMMDQIEEANQRTQVASTSREQQTTEHRCKTCGMAFATGQALGGHMRRHYIPENHAAPPPVAPLYDDKSSKTDNTPLKFDLNAVPEIEEEEEEEEEGN
ncbi:zinc finger protein ZAT9-like [Typha angustifolia]|uniref:zinc finger protein ZAT9-like n=1 Tax=Typha angustifolia TaxID=59011 RepID=UPI003C30C302